MLLQMRTFTRSWISYVLLFVLTIAFAIWGIQDVFNGVGTQNVAEVGGRSITPAQLSRELDLRLRGLRREGRNVSQQEAIEAGLHTQSLESLIGRTALHTYADKIGVSASDVQVANRIREIPAVINSLSGTFDQAQYAQFLQEYRYSQPEFEREIRDDLTTEMVMQAMTAGVRAPSSFGALALAFESETRTITIAEAPMSLVGAIPAPTPAQIQTFYEDNAENLRVPEYRALTLVYARAQDFIARVDVPETRLREEFEGRRAALAQPEKRTFVRLAAQSEQQANDAVTRLNRGESVDAVAQALRLQAARAEEQTREQVTDPRVAEAVFSMAANAPARAVRAQLTPWAVVKVEAIIASRAPDFASQREQLRQDIASDEAAELLNAAVTAFDEARAAGGSAADAARASGLTVINVPAVDEQGADREGQPVAVFAEHPDLLATVFETGEGESSDFLPGDNGDVVIAVDRVIPASVRPLAEVRDQLVLAWTARERVRRIEEIGAEITQAVAGGQSFAAAVRAQRANVVVSSQPIDRRAASQIPARRLAGLLFNAREGEVVRDLRADGGALLIARVESIQRADPAQARERIEANRLQMESAVRGSLGEALQSEIVAQAEPRRNEELIRRTFSIPGDEETP